MLLRLVATAALAASHPSPSTAEGSDHGDLPWFEGAFPQLLETARAENRIVFLDFWADW